MTMTLGFGLSPARAARRILSIAHPTAKQTTRAHLFGLEEIVIFISQRSSPWSGVGRQHQFHWFTCENIELASGALVIQLQMKRRVAPDPHGSPMLRVGGLADQRDGRTAETELLDTHPLRAANVPRNCVGRRIHAHPNAILDQ